MKNNIIPFLIAYGLHYAKPKTKSFDPQKKCKNCVFYDGKVCEKTGLKIWEEGGLLCSSFIKKL